MPGVSKYLSKGGDLFLIHCRSSLVGLALILFHTGQAVLF